MMSEANFSRGDIACSPEESNIRNRVMGITEGTPADKCLARREKTADRMNFRRLDGLLKGHRWHNAGDAFCEHRLP